MRKILLLFLFLFFGCDDKDNTFEPNYLGTYSITFTTAGYGNAPVQIIDNFSSRENISENDYHYPEIIYGRVTSIENEIIGSGTYIDILGNQQSYNYPTSSIVTFEYDPRMFEDEELKLKVANAYNMVTAEVTSSEIIRYEFTGRALRKDSYLIINYSCPDGNSPSGYGISMIPRWPGWANDTCCYDGDNRMWIYANYNCST